MLFDMHGVIAGVGFVGRHLTSLLVESSLASHIRVVDKAPPATGWLSPQHKVGLFTSLVYTHCCTMSTGSS